MKASPLLLSFGAFQLDEARFELREGGEVIAVQPKVLELILYLARHRDRVVPKDELFEEVWEGTMVTEASLTQAASLARRALGDSAKDQRMIRTVRRKGLQFVAPVALPRAVRAPRITVTSGATFEETLANETESSGDEATARLEVVLHGEAVAQGGASWSLEGVDEVQLMRGSVRRFERTDDVSKVLTIALPGKRLSRRHARIVRTQDGWVVVDDGSRNGTTVDGEPVTKRALEPGNVIGCGRNLLRLNVGPPSDAVLTGDDLLGSVTPRVVALSRDLERIAPSEIPVLLLGESGVGKSFLAERLHERSTRRGAMVRLEAATLPAELDALPAGAGGTLILESLERIPARSAPVLTSLLDGATDRRLICTSCATFDELLERVPRELLMRAAGYRCTLPPLRERSADLGVLLSRWLADYAPGTSLSDDAAAAMLAHPWPGNLRELRHVIIAASHVAEGGRIERANLPDGL